VSPTGKVVDLPRGARQPAVTGTAPWRRRAGDPRAEADDTIGGDDFDVPAFLRRQAD